MCASCGCGKPNDNHGDTRNITLSQLESAADAAKSPLADVADNLAAAVEPNEDASAETAGAESR